ncbi:hypothetical protein [Paraburkholderia sp. MM5477-R1]|uniref:hypothetical protein n=1 Tax=Paraburkholderia sp. MM5477-R1 TaxID=2991062 RepID=UPI003D1F4AD8
MKYASCMDIQYDWARRQYHGHVSKIRGGAMCYSAQIEADYRKYVKEFGADVSLREFAQLYWERSKKKKVKIPKAVDASFADPKNEIEREIKALIDQFNLEQTAALEQELFRQRERLADAERASTALWLLERLPRHPGRFRERPTRTRRVQVVAQPRSSPRLYCCPTTINFAVASMRACPYAAEVRSAP